MVPKKKRKNDLFFRARVKFVLYCMLVSAILLGAVFTVTYVTVSTAVEQHIRVQLTSSIASSRPDEKQKAPKNTCLIVRFEGKIYYENDEGYTDAEKEAITKRLVDPSGDFVDNGVHYSYLGESYGTGYLFAVYDSTTEYRGLKRALNALSLATLGCLGILLALSWLYSYRIIQPTKEALNKQRELVANASHELKTPLAVISANASLLADSAEGEEEKKRLSAITAQVERMNKLILEMLDLSKLEAGGVTAVSEEVDLSSLVDGCLLCMEASFFEKGISVQTAITPGVKLQAVKDDVEKVILILLDNALKYCDPYGKVNVNLQWYKRGAVFTVTNTGKGLTEENCKRIFDRFYKVETGDGTAQNSFGLGLAIASELVRKAGGSVKCTSVYGESTTFTVIFNE